MFRIPSMPLEFTCPHRWGKQERIEGGSEVTDAGL